MPSSLGSSDPLRGPLLYETPIKLNLKFLQGIDLIPELSY